MFLKFPGEGNKDIVVINQTLKFLLIAGPF